MGRELKKKPFIIATKRLNEYSTVCNLEFIYFITHHHNCQTPSVEQETATNIVSQYGSFPLGSISTLILGIITAGLHFFVKCSLFDTVCSAPFPEVFRFTKFYTETFPEGFRCQAVFTTMVLDIVKSCKGTFFQISRLLLVPLGYIFQSI